MSLAAFAGWATSPYAPAMKPKIITTLQAYSARQFVEDVIAGLIVAMVALPLSIAIAIASGADPAKGIVTAIVGGLLISLLGGSRVQIGGPTGAFIVVVSGVIAAYGYDGLVLATLLVRTAWNMSEPNKWRGYLAAPNEERLLLLLTLVLTVFANLTIAIGAGVGIGLLLRWRKKQAPVGEWKVPDR